MNLASKAAKLIATATSSLLTTGTASAATVIASIRSAQGQPSSQLSSDARWVGAMPYCPLCGHPQAWAVVQVDQGTFEIEAYGLDVRCFGCGANYKLACPADEVNVER